MPPFVPSFSLSAAVDEFNERAGLDELGKVQPLLTVDEVTTAIRSAGRHQLPLSENQRRHIHSIAETQSLPAGAKLTFTTSCFAPSGYYCEVWWIDLVLSFPTHPGEVHSSSCSVRIRDHRLRSWHDPSVVIPTEIQRLQADHRWFPATPARSEVSSHH